MSSCKILYIIVGVGGGVPELTGTWLVGFWKGSTVWLDVTYCYWRSSHHHGTRVLSASPLQCCCWETKLLSSHFIHLTISYFCHFAYWKSSFLNAPWNGFSPQKYKTNTQKKTPVCERMAGLGVDFFFLENIIYFCAILNVFVDCCFSFCLFFFF